MAKLKAKQIKQPQRLIDVYFKEFIEPLNQIGAGELLTLSYIHESAHESKESGLFNEEESEALDAWSDDFIKSSINFIKKLPENRSKNEVFSMVLDAFMIGLYAKPSAELLARLNDCIVKEKMQDVRAGKKIKQMKRQYIIEHKFKQKLSVSDSCAKLIIEKLETDFAAADVDYSVSTIKRDIKSICSRRAKLTE